MAVPELKKSLRDKLEKELFPSKKGTYQRSEPWQNLGIFLVSVDGSGEGTELGGVS